VRPSDIRDLSEAELDTRLHELEEELFGLRLRRATSQLENPMKLRITRRDLARLRTIKHERERAR
jgi:large subunit ribosomal protein L29